MTNWKQIRDEALAHLHAGMDFIRAIELASGKHFNTIAEVLDYITQEAEPKCETCFYKNLNCKNRTDCITNGYSYYKSGSAKYSDGTSPCTNCETAKDNTLKVDKIELQQKAKFKRIADVYVNIDEPIHNIRSEKDMWGKEYATLITYKDGRSTYISLPINEAIQQLVIEVV